MAQPSPFEFEAFAPSQAQRVEFVLHDIDDTITTRGKLTAGAYGALWRLKEAGLRVAPVTGRPAGWCDMIIRQWPVDFVVGENGAFVYYWQDGAVKTWLNPQADGDSHKRLMEILGACMERVPGCAPSRDQFARRYDLAIDFAEDAKLTESDARGILEICLSMGAVAKISSIHVNAWFGRYDKLTTTRLFMEQVLGVENINEKTLFFGDSPNDGPMFGYFPMSCAVENIRPFLKTLDSPPAFVTKGEGGEGFCKAVELLLELKRS